MYTIRLNVRYAQNSVLESAVLDSTDEIEQLVVVVFVVVVDVLVALWWWW
jgi:acyl-coenzyme A synthetase/AMP-(fatty) acid ligase